jgi:hypothetical protein
MAAEDGITVYPEAAAASANQLAQVGHQVHEAWGTHGPALTAAAAQFLSATGDDGAEFRKWFGPEWQQLLDAIPTVADSLNTLAENGQVAPDTFAQQDVEAARQLRQSPS